jgi:hypothetical protein
MISVFRIRVIRPREVILLVSGHMIKNSETKAESSVLHLLYFHTSRSLPCLASWGLGFLMGMGIVRS